MGVKKQHITIVLFFLAQVIWGQENNLSLSCHPDQILEITFDFAQKAYPELAAESLVEYMSYTGDFEILSHASFEPIQDTAEFIAVQDKYGLKLEIFTFFYLYVGLIGIFIALILNLRRRSDRMANGLISAFVFMHSFFLIHLSLYLTNYTFRVPHTQSMSTWLSFLYGPILYFYFKRVTVNYTFKWRDGLHLIPTLVYFVFFIPIYSLSGSEKLMMMLERGIYENHPYLAQVTILKLISLLAYGYLTFMIYYKHAKTSAVKNVPRLQLQRTILAMHAVYALSYGIYGTLIISKVFNGWLFHTQLLAMTALVLYIGYMAYSRPKFLSIIKEKIRIPKYRNSGLTPSFSEELWVSLKRLMEDEKLYRQNDIKLETIASRLGTTRHNASQIINEHAGLNFFELINQYRIEEAKRILSSTNGKLNIIDIAYEVGYNNKVTFNKSFKRFASLTPSQFRRQLHIASA